MLETIADDVRCSTPSGSLRLTTLVAASALLLAGCGGSGGGNGSNGRDGRDGRAALVFVSTEPAGANCTSGGTKVSAGLDADGNGELGPTEVDSIQYICNGADGPSGSPGSAGAPGADGLTGLVRTSAEPAGSRCAAGGTVVSVGADLNRNGALDDSEVTSAATICNGTAGASGATGATGATGADGFGALVSMTPEPAGANCTAGGTRVSTGQDINRNNTLDTAEVSAVRFLCNGESGATGATGPAGVAGADGLNTLVLLVPEPAGANCATSGVRVSAGRDADRNGVLSAGEVEASSYVCNGSAGATGATGAAGATSLVSMSVEPAGANCSAGGTRLDSGVDANANGTLDLSEVATTRYVCNGATGSTGATGPAGATGATGANGFNSLISIVGENAGANCTYGGRRISSGLDSDRSGALDVGEIDTVTYVCNGEPGPGVTWTSSGASGTAVTAQPNTGVLAANDAAQVVITLPASPAVGDLVSVSGVGAGGWKIAQQAGQSIITRGLPGVFQPAGVDWTQRQSGLAFKDIASSSDGQKLVAVINGGQIYTSTNAGASWTARDSNRDWVSVASSADGVKLVAAVNNGQLYTSSDSGVTWTARDSSRQWTDVASSADGSRLVASVDSIGGGAIYVSVDSGATWSLTSASTSVRWFSVTSSADGQKLAANGGLDVYTSTNGGTTWTSRQTLTSQLSLSASSDGSRLTAATTGGVTPSAVYVSLDSGITWTRRLAGLSTTYTLGAAAVSADGSLMMAAANNYTFTSTDQGRSWVTLIAPATYTTNGLALSSNGVLAAAATSAGVYASSASGAATTVGIGGSISGAQYDSIELQYAGGGVFTVLKYGLNSGTGFVVQ